MANSFVSPENGREDANVIPKTGGIAFDIPLYDLETTGGASYALTLSYKSSMLKEDYGTWAPESPENLIGVGWGLSIGSRICIIQKYPVKYGLYFNGIFYQLKEENTQGNQIHYSTVSYSLLHIIYYKVQQEWIVFSEDGTQYVFGRNDDFTNEHGTYSENTGTYAQAGSEYNKVRNLISHPNAQGIPANANADNTMCRTTENTLLGYNNWVGPTSDAQVMQPQATTWLLSHILDSFDNTISFSYVQHISNFNVSTTKTYSVASYLYRICVYCKSVLTEKITIEYGAKEDSEYSVDFIATPRPNGCQQKFEKLYIKKLVHHSISFQVFKESPSLWVTDQVQFNTKLIKPANNIVKRQLLEVQFLAKDTLDMQVSPSYQMTYYGSADGVSPSESGFDDVDHRYYNAKTGALFGSLKTISYPSGEVREYKYLEHDINSVFTTVTHQTKPSKAPTVIMTPYGYTIVIFMDSTLMRFFVYTGTNRGLQEQLLCTRIPTENYDYERLVSYSEHMIGLIAKQKDGHYYANVFYKKTEDDTWATGQPEESINEYPESWHVSVSDYGFAYTDKTSSDNRGVIVYHITDDYGKTFKATWQKPLNNVLDEGSNYRILLKALDDKCLIFAMNRTVIPAPPELNIDRNHTINSFNLKVTGIRADGTLIPVSNLGRGNMLKYQYLPTHSDATNYSMGYVFTGGLVERAVGVDLVGNFFVLRLKTRGSILWARVRKPANITVLDYQATNESDWSVVLFHQNNMEEFYDWNKNIQQKALEKVFRIQTTMFMDSESVIDSSVKVTENGIIYTIHYGTKQFPKLETSVTSFCTYLGGDRNNFKLQQYNGDDYNLVSCISKDNMFAIFQGKTTKDGYQKKYMYYNPSSAVWAPIQTGTVTSPSTTYNESAETALHAIFIIGIILSVALLPFGLTTAVGIITTAVSVGLFVAAEVTCAVLQNSLKSSLNLETSSFGNRFINDGTTIWFRNQQQDRMTAIGNGTAYQPHDSLDGTKVTGRVLSSSQQFGHIYNFVPFFTDQKKLYYRVLKNNAVGLPIPLGGASVNISDLYLDPREDAVYAYVDNYVYKFISGALVSQTNNDNCPFRQVDACCMVSTKDQTIYVQILASGQKACYKVNSEGYHAPCLLSDIFIGTRFHYTDGACALLKGGNDKDEEFFYLFCDREYEIVKYTFSTRKFIVTEHGTLDQYLKDRKITNFPYDKIDAVYDDNGTIYIRNNQFVKYADNGTLLSTGRMGDQLLAEPMDADDVVLTYSDHVLSYYKKKSKTFHIQYLMGGSLNQGLKSYVVDTVSFYDDPRFNGVPSSVTKYKYHTGCSTHVRGTGTAVFSEVDVCTMEEES